MESAPLISVLIPVYNTSQFVGKCLESLIKASEGFPIEIIVVDDGSTDNSFEIIKQIAKKTPFVHVYSKDNGGLVSTRKYALDKARGEYVLNVDSDDWVEYGIFEALFEIIKKEEFDIVSFDFFQGNEAKRMGLDQGYNEGAYCDATLEQLRNTMLFDEKKRRLWSVYPNIWCKLMKRRFVERFQYDVPDCISFGEDSAVIYPAFLEASKVYICREKLYNYRDNNNSMVRSFNNSLYDRQRELFKFLRDSKVNSTIQRQLDYYCFLMMNRLIVNELRNPNPDLSRKIKIWSESEVFKESIRNIDGKSLPFKHRFIHFLVKHRLYGFTALICYAFKKRLLEK